VAGAPEPRFLADGMLGGLARWLRLLGMDTGYDSRASDRALVEQARRENRILLTQDRHLLGHARGVETFRVPQGGPLDQLSEVAAVFELRCRLRPFSRCNRCNTLLEPLPPDFAGRVPEDLAGGAPSVTHCPGCGRIYWPGAHTRRIRAALDRILGPGAAG
jgi:uncharacterized protein with PIN domain